MAFATKPFMIGIEEQYYDPDVAAGFESTTTTTQQRERLLDLGDGRLKFMAEAGIDFQVISHSPGSVQRLNPETAPGLIATANNRLHAAVDAHPDKFAGFAALPVTSPEDCADELERSVKELGFKGAQIPPQTNGVFLDDKRFWPMWERAAALGVPIYIHPSGPMRSVVEAYFGEYAETTPAGNLGAYEAATVALRMVLSGVFDEYPGIKVILGHMGETLPFSIDRISGSIPFNDYFRKHFYITTSGFFSTPALMCCIAQLGIDRVIFSVDFPYADSVRAVKWMSTTPLSPSDREKVFSLNARNLLNL